MHANLQTPPLLQYHKLWCRPVNLMMWHTPVHNSGGQQATGYCFLVLTQQQITLVATTTSSVLLPMCGAASQSRGLYLGCTGRTCRRISPGTHSTHHATRSTDHKKTRELNYQQATRAVFHAAPLVYTGTLLSATASRACSAPILFAQQPWNNLSCNGLDVAQPLSLFLFWEEASVKGILHQLHHLLISHLQGIHQSLEVVIQVAPKVAGIIGINGDPDAHVQQPEDVVLLHGIKDLQLHV